MCGSSHLFCSVNLNLRVFVYKVSHVSSVVYVQIITFFLKFYQILLIKLFSNIMLHVLLVFNF